MTDINTRGKLPFTVVSSSVNTGYAAELTAAVGQNIDLTNHHRDQYGQLENSPAQGPFTHQHVGGNQHRHANLNSGNDNSNNRSEGYFISASQGSVKIYGPDVKGASKPRATLTRDFTAKSPVNIKNIATSGNVAGNFEQNYQVIQNVGRRLNNNLIVDGFEATGDLTTKFVKALTSAEPFYIQSQAALTSSGDGVTLSDQLGSSVAIDSNGTIVAAGSPNSDQPSSTAGSVIIFKNSSLGWFQDGVPLTSSGDGNTNTDILGWSVAIDSNGIIIAAGSPGSDQPSSTAGSVIVFKSSSLGWFQNGPPLTSSGDGDATSDQLGYSVSINSDGTIIAAGCPSSDQPSSTAGSVIIFKSSSLGWFQNGPPLTSSGDGSPTNDSLGNSVAINSNGTVVIAGSPYSDQPNSFAGSIIVFKSSSLGWFQDGPPLTSSGDGSPGGDLLGDSIAINSDGTIIAAGCADSDQPNSSAGSVIVFKSSSLGWFQNGPPLTSSGDGDATSDNLGYSVSINSAGTIIAAGCLYSDQPNSSAGSVIVFKSSSLGWFQDGTPLISSGDGDTTSDKLGYSVSINSDGTIIAAGSIDSDQPNSSAGSVIIFKKPSSAVTDVNYTLPDIIRTDAEGKEYKNKTTFVQRFNAPGGKEESSRGTLDRIGEEFSANNSLTTRNIKARQPYYNQLSQHAAQFNSGSTYKLLPDTGTTDAVTIHGVNRNTINGLSAANAISTFGQIVFTSLLSGEEGNNLSLNIYISTIYPGNSISVSGNEINVNILDDFPASAAGIESYLNDASNWPDNNQLISVNRNGQNFISSSLFLTFSGGRNSEKSKYDNFWVQHSIPATDLRYTWITGSISSSQQPIQYQSYNLPYSTSSSYNSNGAYEDLEFKLKGPFGDHLGISGAIDKDEMFVSTYTNTMYRDRKYLDDFEIDLSKLSSEISKKDFTISFWVKINLEVTEGGLYLLEYSGSLGKNRLQFNINADSGLGSLTVENSTIPSNLTEYVDIKTCFYNDNKWHLITLVSDISTSIVRINNSTGQIRKSTNTKIYYDAGLVYEKQQKFVELDITKIILTDVDTGFFAIDEIMIWDSILTEKEILEIHRLSKTYYGDRPKKYVQHKLDNKLIPKPLHVYSSRIDKNKNILFDEVGNIDVDIRSFTKVLPQTNNMISYSTYFNGPYQGANWKSIRNNEHPVTRKLTTENTNIVSVVIPEGSHDVFRTVRGIQVKYTLPGSRKQGTILNVKESPVYINNKPLKHKFILKDSPDRNVGFELTHTYVNNLQYFANKQLNDTLGLGKKERQIYDTLLDYCNGTVDDNENPIERFVGYTYGETIFPSPQNGLLKDVRQRTDYITDQPGYSIDGYDRQLGTQRVFWRDNQQDRMRTVNNYFTSLDEQIQSYYTNLPFQTPSISVFEFITESNNLQYIKQNSGFNKISYMDIAYKQSSELNQLYSYQIAKMDQYQNYYNYIFPVRQIPEIYFFKSLLTTTRDDYNVILKSGLFANVSYEDPSSLRFIPSYCYEHCSYVFTQSLPPIIIIPDPRNKPPEATKTSVAIYNNFTHDFGLNRVTEKISGKNPWYDSYEDYYVDVKNLSNDNLKAYSKIPEFKISDSIKELIGLYSGDATKITLDDYNTVSISKNKDDIYNQNEDFVYQDTIKIIVGGVKKLLPYNGFYPQDRSIQLVNYLKESWLDTDAIGGGLLLTASYSGVGTPPKILEITSSSDKLAQTLKQISFLEPLYAPGIFYNMIKSGIAVDWNMYTGSIPIPNTSGGDEIVAIIEKPKYRISFETLLNLQDFQFSSSLDGSENKHIKFKDIEYGLFDSKDYGTSIGYNYSFQGFFTKQKEGTPVYTLSINNFLAETINFFLKNSSLNSFISKPDSEFSVFDSNKTYYMDVVLRKNDIIMCEAHSSSLADKFGQMKGRYFGPAFWTGSLLEAANIKNNGLFSEILKDPAYCSYTPPYYYGDSVARISFKPPDDGKYTLDQIFTNSTIEYFNNSFINDSIFRSGSLYSSFVMPLNSSIKLKGTLEERQRTVDPATIRNSLIDITTTQFHTPIGTFSNQTGIKKWVISPKMETPVLDFSNQEFITSTNLLSQSFVDQQLKSISSSHTPPTGSGFGIGMWSGYGEIPVNEKGIFLELKESYPRELIGIFNPVTQKFIETNTGSLIDACGFRQSNQDLSKKIGELADSRDISEAIIIIPYSDNVRTTQVARIDEDKFLFVNDTIDIEGHNFFKIEQEMFNTQLQNISNGKDALLSGQFGLTDNIRETSISKMIQKMSKYVLPPNFDFLVERDLKLLQGNDIKPFVMYIAEFTSNLDKQDLADIWQGVMPKIAMRAEREEQVISHSNTLFDFFHGKGLPKDVKFMIFKAKKRAEINYYKMTADSTDDGLFPSIQAGKPASPYSFNWPYDYCSLVETAKVDIQIEYLSGSNNI